MDWNRFLPKLDMTKMLLRKVELSYNMNQKYLQLTNIKTTFVIHLKSDVQIKLSSYNFTQMISMVHPTKSSKF